MGDLDTKGDPAGCLRRFEHSPLNGGTSTIRVLQILEGKESQEIQCTLKHVELLRATNYVCLSYMWGDAAANHTISINGQPFQVRQSLFEFLYQARSMRIRREWFWIDAICIDQTDISERNAQVRIMGDIYRQARYVIIYPGVISRPRAVKATINMWSLFDKITRKSRNWSSPSYRPTRLTNFWDELFVTKHMREFMVLPYWERMWVVQEIALARKAMVLSGKKLKSWSDFVNLPIRDRGLRRGWEFLHQYGKHETQEHINENIIYMLERCARRQCQIVNDHVYALLSLVNVPTAFPIDYARDAATVVLDVLEHFGAGQSTVPLVLDGRAIHVSHALRSWPLLLCYACFTGTKPHMSHPQQIEGASGMAHQPAAYCKCGEHPLRFVWVTEPPGISIQTEAIVDQSTKHGKQFRDIGKQGKFGRCDDCNKEVDRCSIAARIVTKRLHDSVLSVTIDHDIDHTEH